MRRLTNEQKIGFSVMAVLVVVGAVAVVVGQVKHYLDRLSWQDPAAADRFISDLIVVGIVIVAVLGCAGLSLALAALGRWQRRHDEEFEKSIAHLPVEHQQAARRQRAMRDAAIAMGVAAGAHVAMEFADHRRQNDLERTRERNRQVHDALAANLVPHVPGSTGRDDGVRRMIYDENGQPIRRVRSIEDLRRINEMNGY